MINKILGLSEKYDKSRAQNLRRMMELEESNIQELKLVDLRNSMEHIDERLDLLYKLNPSEVVIWDLTKNSDSTEHVLRKFNPETLTLQCIGTKLKMHTLNVKKCYGEIQYVETAIEKGCENLTFQKTGT